MTCLYILLLYIQVDDEPSDSTSTSASMPSTASTAVDVSRQRKFGTEKAYPTTVKSAVGANDILRCNCRGIVSLSSGSEKPSLSVEELFENRREACLTLALVGS